MRNTVTAKRLGALLFALIFGVAMPAAAEKAPKRYAACYALWQLDNSALGMWTSKALATDLPKNDIESLFDLHVLEIQRHHSTVPDKVACFVSTSAVSARLSLARGKREALADFPPDGKSFGNGSGKSESDDWLE